MGSHPCIYSDDDYEHCYFDPNDCFQGTCFICGKWAVYTLDEYLSDTVVNQGSKTHNLGERCPVTFCCHGVVCLDCAYQSRIFCKICQKWTRVDFLDKSKLSEWFSEKTNCRSMRDWFDKLVQFDQIHQQLNEDCKLFFLWLKTQKGYIRNGFFHHERESWSDLASVPRRTQVIISDFKRFLVASKMVVFQTFFTRIHHIPVRTVSPVRIDSRRQQMLPYFLYACYGVPFPSSFTRKQMLTEFQPGLVGKLAVRLSQSNQRIQQKQCALIIFSRMMLYLIRKKK